MFWEYEGDMPKPNTNLMPLHVPCLQESWKPPQLYREHIIVAVRLGFVHCTQSLGVAEAHDQTLLPEL